MQSYSVWYVFKPINSNVQCTGHNQTTNSCHYDIISTFKIKFVSAKTHETPSMKHETLMKNSYSISIPIEWDMIVVTVFLSILNHMEFHLVKYRKENRHHDHIPFNVKGKENIVFSMQTSFLIGRGRGKRLSA